VSRVVNIQEAKTHLSKLLRDVEGGADVRIARDGRVIARLVRVEPAGKRKWGIFAGQVTFDPDAFEPPDDPSDWEGELDP